MRGGTPDSDTYCGSTLSEIIVIIQFSNIPALVQFVFFTFWLAIFYSIIISFFLSETT